MINNEGQKIGYQQVKEKKMLDLLCEFTPTALSKSGHPLVDWSEMWFSFHTHLLWRKAHGAV